MRRTTDISSAEWRWVTIFSALFVGLTLVPYVLVLLLDQSVTSWRFMGILSNPFDGATYLAKIAQGQNGAWLYALAHTPEAATPVAIQLFYVWLGQASRLVGFSPLLTFHIARLITGFAMYLMLYYLGATVWQKLRARRLFFGIVGICSGLGWLVLPLGLQPVDFYVPEAIPLYSIYANPHFPLAIGLLALLTAQFVIILRPGYAESPNMGNGGVVVVALSVLIAIIQPQAWLPFMVALVVYFLLQTIRTRKLPQRYELLWSALAILPGFPILLYDVAITIFDPLYKAWNLQNQTPSGSPLNYFFGFGILWLVAAPGIIRAARQFERDGDRLMLVWLLSNLLLLYAPFNLQRRLVIGMILPLGYFCVRSLEDYWLQRIHPRTRMFWIIILFAVCLPSNILALLLPISGTLNPKIGLESNVLLSSDYRAAVDWFRTNATRSTVVMALPNVSLWLPAWSPARVVYAHPFETVDALAKKKKVADFFSGIDCSLTTPDYTVTHVIIGPNATPDDEDNLTPAPENTPCRAKLGRELARFGAVTIYAASP
jgi:hypothetical protein